MDDKGKRDRTDEAARLPATLDAIREAAHAINAMAKALQDALANGGIPIRSPRWAYFFKKCAWQLIGGVSLLVIGILAERYGAAILTYITQPMR